jgi:hypothetical protein
MYVNDPMINERLSERTVGQMNYDNVLTIIVMSKEANEATAMYHLCIENWEGSGRNEKGD